MQEWSDSIHDLLSNGILLPLLRLQQVARPSRRSNRRALEEGLRFRLDHGHWGTAQKSNWVLGRLRFSVRRAYHTTAYYQELFKAIGFDPQDDFGFEDFSRLPTLERENIHRAQNKLISTSVPARQLRKMSTGGSTGTPTDVWLGPEEKGWNDTASEYFMQRIGVPMGTKTGMLWGHHLDPVKSTSRVDRFLAYANNIRWFDCFRLSPEVLDLYHQEFERWQPTCIIAYASALASLAEHVLGRGYCPSYPRKRFVTGAEKLLPQHRELIETTFKRPVHERYGSRDVGLMGFQVDPAQTLDYEVDWANILVEPETDDAESAILITKLHADGMPMLRYRVGDVGRFPKHSKPGHPCFMLHEVLGRSVDRIWLPNGHWIAGTQLPHLLKDFPVREFGFIQHADCSVELQIVPRDGFGEDARISILTTIRANLPGLHVNIRLVAGIERNNANKWRPVISHVNLPQAK